MDLEQIVKEFRVRIFKTLCKTCQSIDFFQLEKHRYKHHNSFAAIRQSSASGCSLCYLIVVATDQQIARLWDGVDNELEETHVSCQLEAGHSDLPGGHSSSTLSFRITPPAHVIRRIPPSFTQLRVFVDHDAPIALKDVISGRPIEDRADSRLCFSLVQRWMDHCLQEHSKTCPTPINPVLPTRVIDVGPSNGSKLPRIHITKGQQGSWMALSHCWGPEPHFSTDSRNYLERQNGIQFSDLSPTFRDAIDVARQLGYQYLWIDSICIIQDSRQDWAQEASRMHEYYKGAVLTITVDSASGDHEGFLKNLRAHVESIAKPIGISVPGFGRHQIYLDAGNTMSKLEDFQTFLGSRAWTFQEDLLSPRTLHYTTKQIVWQCQTKTYCESDVYPLNDKYDLKHFFLAPPRSDDDTGSFWDKIGDGVVKNGDDTSEKLQTSIVGPVGSLGDSSSLSDAVSLSEEFYFEKLVVRWYNIVTEYMKRSLTFQDDRLPAISGIAREHQKKTQHTYKAGLWLEDIGRGLAWYTSGLSHRPEQYRAPSWSWAALDGPPLGSGLRYDESLFHNIYKPQGVKPRPSLEVLACEIVSVDGDPFGCIKSGHLQVRGRMCPASKLKGIIASNYILGFRIRDIDVDLGYEPVHQLGLPDQVTYAFDTPPSEKDGTLGALKSVSLLALSTWDWLQTTWGRPDGEKGLVTVALLLVPADGLGNWRRVGIAEVPHRNGWADDGWEVKEITII